jgi:hypothetical protein
MDILQIIKNLRDNLWAKYGNPLANYKKTQDDVHMTYYVGKLMEEQGHEYIMPDRIKGENEDRVYYSERALHDAFLAGRLLARADRKTLKAELIIELKAQLRDAVDDIEL